MASVVLLAVFLLSGSFPARAQDTRTDQAGSVLREYVDKGYCTYTYVVPPGSRTEGCTPPGLERQLAETKEEINRLSSRVDTLLSRVDSLSAELSKEKIRSAQLERNLTQELQEQKTNHQGQIESLSDQLSEEIVRSAEMRQNFTRKLQEQETRLQTQVQNLTQELQEQETRLQTQVLNLSDKLSEERIRSAQLEQNFTRKLQEQKTSLLEEKGKSARLGQNFTRTLKEHDGLIDSLSDQVSNERVRRAQLEQNLTDELQEQTTRFQTQVKDLSSQLSEERVRSYQLDQNLTQELMAQESMFISIVGNLSAQILKEADRNRGLAMNLTQVELELDNLTTTVHEHSVTITQGVKCFFERPVPGDNVLTTDVVPPAASLPTSVAVLTTTAPSTESAPTAVETPTVNTSPVQEVSTAGASAEKITASTKPVVRTLCTIVETSAAPRTTETTQSGTSPTGAPDSAGPTSGLQVRLADGSVPVEGRVEVRNATGQWGSVCDDNFDLQDAHVVCRQLGFGAAQEVKLAGHFGEGSGNVWLDEVACRGNETDLGDCPADSWGRSDCSHKEDVGVVCAGDAALRLVGGRAPWKGRLQIRPWGALEWGAVCNTGWTEAEAGFVCRQMGYTGGMTSSGQADIGEGSENIWLGDVTCSGDETNILSCGFSWEPSDCHHSQDVQLVCTGGVSLQLVGGQSLSEGRVEVRSGNGDWGTVCDDGFDDRDAQVVCRQLGYYTGFAREGGVFPEGTENIWLDNLNCAGKESSVADCEINRWGDHDCTHKEDAGVVCTDAAEKDCAEYHSSGVTTSGVYKIGLRLPDDVEAYCDMDTAGGGWTVIQRRQDGSVPFNRTWEEYKLGFGNKNEEYWLGNENIHLLTNQKNYCLRIDLMGWNNESHYALYSTFRVSGESDGYRLHISGYSGTAGNSMEDYHSNNGMMFSTVDRDNDDCGCHCSLTFGHAGWWFRDCGNSGLNGRYLGNCGNSCPDYRGVFWWYIGRGYRYSLKYVSMKIKP